MRNVLQALKVAVITLALPATALAQSSITGVVRDTSGAILPGVTVEAHSPALIEKTRTALSDGAGQYRIVDLPPGVYEVVFTLTGFKTVRREGIVLQGTFVAQVNGDLQVGTVEETIVVSGASPVVDVVNNTAQFVADRDVLDAIPTAVRNTPLRALLLPGTQVTPFVLGQYTMSVHGSASQDTVSPSRSSAACRPASAERFTPNSRIQRLEPTARCLSPTRASMPRPGVTFTSVAEGAAMHSFFAAAITFTCSV